MRIKRFEWILFGAGTLLLLAPRMLLVELDGMDEIWIYQFSRRVLHGQVPYRDFSMVAFPLAPQFNAIFLKLFADQLVVLRWIALLLASATALLVYLAGKKLALSRTLALLPTLFFLWSVFSFPSNNYTWFALFFLWSALLGELNLLEARRGPPSRSGPLAFGIGAMLGLAALSKQHIGALGLLASILFELLWAPGRDSVGRAMRRTLLKVLGFATILAAQIFVLAREGALNAFVESALLGPLAFAREAGVPYTQLFQGTFLIALIAVVAPVALVHSVVWGFRLRHVHPAGSQLILIALFGTANFLVVVPAPDATHLLMAMPMSTVGLALVVHTILQSRRFYWADDLWIGVPLLLAPLVFLAVLSVGVLLKGDLRFSRLEHYAHAPISPGFETVVDQVTRTIRNEEAAGTRVHFLDYRAAAFLIPMDRFAPRFDCLLAGNLGRDGGAEVIGGIAKDEKPVVLMSPGSHPLEPASIVAYVKSNFRLVDRVAGFGVYRRSEGGPALPLERTP